MSPAAIATFWVAVGGALGSVGRYWLTIAVVRFAGETFPWGTLLINVLGSFVIAYFGALTLPDAARPATAGMRLFVMVGVCGGFTTFSSFSLQTVEMLRAGESLRAFAYVMASVMLCLLAVGAGYHLAASNLSPSADGQA